MQHNGIFTRLSIKIITGMRIAQSQADPDPQDWHSF